MSSSLKRSLSVSPVVSRASSPSSSLSPLPPSPTQSSKCFPASPRAHKKLKLMTDHELISPFPDFSRPTPRDAHEVHAVLAEHDARYSEARPIPAPDDTSNAAATCGAVANVLDSLIGTILSQNTSASNSSSAKRSLDTTFGRHDFEAISRAPLSAVTDAIRHGGLANRKAKTIQKLLSAVHARHGVYSLQHLAEDPDLTDAQIMAELVAYDGVGPKTAACVLLFCLGRDAFAVDTHVYRLTKLLGWVPAKADRVHAQMHLDAKLPKELKYGLHVMMVRHGRTCKGCKGSGSKGAGCVLKTYLQQRRGSDAKDIQTKVEEVDAEVAGDT
ncbi:DNA glycosylase [Artomyces pyxidatus]|uniref:DNA glycosylase n=1 Tax=Artomyces pyxidatus TaxID=48021 RepID=A0ACB8T7C0_9AGAM|nr:DNA glycosylase [Artomyces pyxidatus]